MVVATSQRLSNTLLRAKPPKGGDAELRDYRDFTRHVRRAASDSIHIVAGGPVRFWARGARFDDVHAQAVQTLGPSPCPVVARGVPPGGGVRRAGRSREFLIRRPH